MENTNANLQKHESTIKELKKKIIHLAYVLVDQKGNIPVMNDIPHASTSVQQECAMKLEPPQETSKTETFSEKEKKRIMETQTNEEKLLKKLESEPVNMTLLPPKEKDLGSFILPCIIGNTTVSNALADLGASISVMLFSMFKRLGLGNLKPVNMVIEMVDRSMQSPKGIVENVLVNIHKFIFSVNFVILDIIEDNKVTIILGRPMLATTHARIDVFGGKISLEVANKQVIFNANVRATPVIVLPVYDNNLFPRYKDPGANPPPPNKSPSRIWNLVEEFQDSDDNLGNNIVKKAKNLQAIIGYHSLLTNFIILENMNEFVEKGLIESEEGIVENNRNRKSRLGVVSGNLDKAKGISHPYQKIKEFYKGCLNLGEEYKQDMEVIDWINQGHASSIRKSNLRSPPLVFVRFIRIVHCVRKYCASDLSSCADSELGSELTSLAGSELGSELTFFAGSELGLESYTSSEDYFPATYEQELCPYIQCADSDTKPLMLDRTDFASWQQWIRLYCQGKENGVNILKSIEEGPFQMGILREILTEGTEGAPGYEEAQNKVGYANPGHARQIKCYNCNGIGHIARNCTQPKRPQNSEYFKDKMLLIQAQENRVTLDEERFSFIAADDCDAFDSNVDEAPTAHTMFMANLSSADHDYDEAGPAYDSDVLSEETRNDADRTLDFRALDFPITQLIEKVLVLQEQNELFRVDNAKVKEHYKELYDSIKIMHSVTPKVLAPGMYAIDVEPISPHLRNNRKFTHPKVVPAKKLENVNTSKFVITENSSHTSHKPLTRYQRRNKRNKAVPAGCLKHMTRDRSRLRNFVKKFIGIVRFRNDYFGAIMGYGDYVIGDSVISREVAFRKHSCYVQDTDGVELIKGSCGSNLYTISVEYMMKSSPICLLSKTFKTKSLLWHRRLNHLNFDLEKLQPTADIGIFVGYAPSRKGYRIYNKRTRRIMETIHVQFDEMSKPMAPMQLCTGPAPTFLMPGQISSGLVPNMVPAAPYVPPTNKDLEILFQPMFDEYLKPSRVNRQVSPTPAVPFLINSASIPLSTDIDQDAPSPIH
nr:hypothetical protein [Tanacetum cinerariifolium]